MSLRWGAGLGGVAQGSLAELLLVSHTTAGVLGISPASLGFARKLPRQLFAAVIFILSNQN